jgi:hypothetical protein
LFTIRINLNPNVGIDQLMTPAKPAMPGKEGA